MRRRRRGRHAGSWHRLAQTYVRTAGAVPAPGKAGDGVSIGGVQPIFVLAALGGTDCEHLGTGWLAQPANAASSLAYVVVGGWLLRRAAQRRTDRVRLVVAGTAMAAVGLASGAYHGPQPAWAGPAHDWSIVGLA